MQDKIVTPGDFISDCNLKNKCGPMTYVSNGNILASAFGKVKYDHLNDETCLVSVVPFKRPGVVPTVNSIVLAKVSSINRRLIRCDIIAVDSIPLAGPFRGLIRREDIRATQRDQAEPTNCYRPGDIIRARVINVLGSGANVQSDMPNSTSQNDLAFLTARAISYSVGATNDSNSNVCLLSTAETDLGVVIGIGRSPDNLFAELLGRTSGSPLIPVSWTEMLCPHTLARYPRKVARIPEELIDKLVNAESS